MSKEKDVDEFGESIARLLGDDVELDEYERSLIEMKRCKIIDGKRFIVLLSEHIRETESGD